MNEIYIPLRNNFFELAEFLKPGEMRTLALLLSYREDFVIHENTTAKQQGTCEDTIGRRFKRFMDLGLLCKTIKTSTYKENKDFDWTLTFKVKKYRANRGQKYYTLFKQEFILDKSLNSLDWEVLSMILCNKVDYKNRCCDIWQGLFIPQDKRSKVSKSLKRLESKGLVFKGIDSENNPFYSATDKAWEYVIHIDRSKYETKEEKHKNMIENASRNASILLYNQAKKAKKDKYLQPDPYKL